MVKMALALFVLLTFGGVMLAQDAGRCALFCNKRCAGARIPMMCQSKCNSACQSGTMPKQPPGLKMPGR